MKGREATVPEEAMRVIQVLANYPERIQTFHQYLLVTESGKWLLGIRHKHFPGLRGGIIGLNTRAGASKALRLPAQRHMHGA